MLERLVSLIWGGLAVYAFYTGDNGLGIGFMALHYLSRIDARRD